MKKFASCLLAFVLVFGLVACGSAKAIDINLNDFIFIEFDGLDGEGTAECVFNNSAFEKEYNDLIEFKDDSAGNAMESLVEYLSSHIGISKDSGLSNGDTVDIQWNISLETIEKKYNVALEFSDYGVTVKGLEETYLDIVDFNCDKNGETLYLDTGELMLFTAEIDTNMDITGKVVLRMKENAEFEHTMYDSATMGDETAGDGIYSVKLSNNFETVGEKVFYVDIDGTCSDTTVNITFEEEPELEIIEEPEISEKPEISETPIEETEELSESIEADDTATEGEKEALKTAKDYLDVMSFSYSSLIEQLEYEGFSAEEATYGADNCDADWNKQAVDKAKDYLDMMAFSQSGLIEQLEFEGFTTDEATYGVNNCDADWNEQAVRKAESYLSNQSFSHERLVEQLEYEGFTTEQAEYGATQAES